MSRSRTLFSEPGQPKKVVSDPQLKPFVTHNRLRRAYNPGMSSFLKNPSDMLLLLLLSRISTGDQLSHTPGPGASANWYQYRYLINKTNTLFLYCLNLISHFLYVSCLCLLNFL